MKKVTSIIVILIALIATSVPSFADTPNPVDESGTYTTVKSETTYIGDGSYYTTVVKQSVVSDNKLRAASSTKTGTKRTTYYNSAGASLWYVQVSGTFTYNGSSATCTGSTVSAASQSSDWVISSMSTSRSGNQATGSATAKCYKGSIVMNTVSKTATLACSAAGTLS